MSFLTADKVIWLFVPIFVGVPIWWVARVCRYLSRAHADLRAALSDLDAALLHKHSLVKRLAEAAMPHVALDRNVISDLNHYNDRAISSRWNIKDHARDEVRLDTAVKAVYSVVDRADLDGDARFMRDLKREFVASENHVDVAVRAYNARVDFYNAAVTMFPYSVLAKRLMHLRPEQPYATFPEQAAGARSLPLAPRGTRQPSR